MKDSKTKAAQYILLFILGWTFFFNVTIKEFGPVEAFFQLINTISEDMIMEAGAGIFIALALMIAMTFGVFCFHILSRWDGFSRFDTILKESQNTKELFVRMLHISKEPQQESCCPSSAAGVILSLTFLYALGLSSILFFSQGFFFLFPSAESKVSEIVLVSLAPLIALRGLSACRYPFLQPLVGLVLCMMGIILFLDISFLWLEEDTRFLLFPTDKIAQKSYIYSGILYSFLLVLLEGLYWLVVLFSSGETKE